jgi:hypothetical protein
VNGITSNQVVRPSSQTSLFHLVRQQGGTTAAAAYYFFSELYNQAPFHPLHHREQHDLDQPIQHSRFYWDDSYPDSHLFADAAALQRDHNPDFLLIHPGGMDAAGHQYGGESKQYRNQAIAIDDLLAQYLPLWMEDYQIVITADHGMNGDGQHGGTSTAERAVPLFCISPRLRPGVYPEVLPQLAIAPLVCQLLNLPPTPKWASLPFPGLIRLYSNNQPTIKPTLKFNSLAKEGTGSVCSDWSNTSGCCFGRYTNTVCSSGSINQPI